MKLNKYDKSLLFSDSFQEYVTLVFLKDDYNLETHTNLKTNLDYYKTIVKNEFEKY